LVAKVHHEVRRFRDSGFDVFLIGRVGHDEVVGTLGQAPGVRLVEPGADVSKVRVSDPERVACVMQTTLSHQDTAPVVGRLRERFRALAEPAAEDICFATRNRQAAIAWLAGRVDVMLVVGDRTSSNSRRLCEAASATGTPAYLIGSLAELQDAWLADASVIGLSAGASTPEHLVTEVVAHFRGDGASVREEMFLDEHVSFGLPAGVLARLEAPVGAELRGSRSRPR
jgi:4-hydroxy-3-methylbut-2-enyl diphosphate reductase